MTRANDDSRDPRVYAAEIRTELDELVEHLRRDVEHVDEPRAQALFETSAEVLVGLTQAFKDYDAGRERAFRAAAASASGPHA